MMPVIRINDATFDNLGTLTRWFGAKTPGEAIDRIVRETMEELGIERDDEPESVATKTIGGAIQFENAPGLTFTKPLTASVNGKSIQNPRWRGILLATIEQVKAKGFEGEKLVRELGIPAKAQKYEEEGFTYHSHLGISIQGQSAADAWKEIDRLAKKWSIPVTVEFWWRQNEKAAHPGRTGLLRSGQ
jgi:hypothetical protein